MLKRLARSFLHKLKMPTSPKPTPAPSSATTEISEDDASSFTYVTEGKATILTPQKDEVFYNPIQQFNRDLSTMSILAYDEMRTEAAATKSSRHKKRKLPQLTILESLAASGLRSCRYGLEIPRVHKIVANDLLPEAVASINRNIQHNKLDSVVVANQGDATHFMSSTKSKFHIIDLDPYGTAAPFIDSALACLDEDGMLLVTCTDAAILAGSGYPEKCFALYGGNNFGNSYINSESNHEVGIRLMLRMIAQAAAKYRKAIEPMLSLSIDYYFRVWVKVKTSPIRVKDVASETMLTFGCNGCGHKIVQPLGIKRENKFAYPKLQPVGGERGGGGSSCQYCGGSHTIAGPMYAGEIQNHEFIDWILKINENASGETYKTRERIKGMLTLAKSELMGVPFFFNLNNVSALFKAPPISIDEYSKAVGNLGYDVSLTHAKKNCVKTDVPWNVNLEIFKKWNSKQNETYLQQMRQRAHDGEELSDKAKDKVAKLEKDIYYSPNLNEKSPGAEILRRDLIGGDDVDKNKDKGIEIDFDTENRVSSKIAKLRKVKMVRYQENPTKNWGPMSRPK